MKKTLKKGALHTASHRVLSMTGLAVMGSLAVASFVFTAFLASPTLLSGQLAAVVSSRLVSLTNDDRSDGGLETLTVSPQLTQAAQAKANDMAAQGYFAHVSPDGRNSWAWFKDVGYSFSYAGENLAVDFTDSGDVNQAWLNSPTHRANIMNGRFTEIGIATAEGEFQGRKTTFVVQMFGTPAKLQKPVVADTLPLDAKQPALASAEPAKAVLGSSVDTGNAQPRVAAGKEATVDGAPGKVAGAENQGLTYENAQGPKKMLSFLGSPRDLLRYLYIFFALILLCALFVRTRLEIKLHHARHAAAVLVLIAIMGGLFIAADRFVFIAPIIAEGASNSSS